MTQAELERVGEYVLGLLEGPDAEAFERQLAQSPELAAAVDRLRRHLHALDDTAMPLPANPELWARIDAGLGAGATVVPSTRLPPPDNDNHNSWMRFAGLAASVLVALGVGYLAGSTTGAQRAPVMVAVLLSEDAMQPGAIVEAFADDSVRLMPLDRFEVPEGRVLEVWTLPDPATGPVSLGTFSNPQTINLAGPDLPPPMSGQLYEITLEPAGGSPTGRPTGPILVKGFAKAPL
ncbi:MAG: anti-sigma factor [Devosia sp.]|uniref:anti-sigma factor n=1 Tax=Devosia sp. TaxID=1871048 RepID=UPI0033974A02